MALNSQNSSVLTPQVGPSSIGVKAKAPVGTPPSNQIAGNQIQAPTSSPIPSNGGYKAGDLTAYLKTKGMTADDNTLNTLATKYGLSGYQNNPTYNSQILSKLKEEDSAPKQMPPLATTSVPTVPTINTPQPTYSPSDSGLYGKLVADLANRSTQSGEDYKAAQAEANRIAAERAKLSQDFAEKDKNIKGTAGFLTQAAGLQSILQGQYNQGQAALSAQEASAASRLGAATSQQGLLQQALQSAIGSAAPQQAGATNLRFDPVTGQYSNPAYTAYGAGGLAELGSTLAQQNLGSQFATDYATGLANLQAADSIQNQIISTLQANPQLNAQPVSAFTNLNEFFSGQSSAPGQQLLSQQVNNYIKQLGLDPASVVNIAYQQQGTLAQLLDSLRQTAQAQVEAKNPANLKFNQGTQPSTSTSGDTTSAGGYQFKLVDGKWVPA